MKTKIRVAVLAVAAALSGTSQAALYNRGGGLIYDSDLNVTWLQDANYAKTSGYDADGLMTWSQATTWTDSLSYYDSVRNVTYTNWRLPTTTDTGTPGCNFAYVGTDCGYNVDTASSEMAHLFFAELGNTSGWGTGGGTRKAGTSGVDWGLVNKGPFTNFQPLADYWSGTEYAPNTADAWMFRNWSGAQDRTGKSASMNALVVRPGDVASLSSIIYGSYGITQGQNLFLDGAASSGSNPIIQYAWDLNGDATYDVFGAMRNVDNATLAGLGMGAGTYTMSLKVTDTYGTFSVSSATLTITAVPEPETYAMMLAGLGLVGYAARRRRG